MATPQLHELQALFWRSLVAATPEPALAAVIPPRPGLEPSQRFDIYAEMYFWRILDTLREDFPRVAALLGDEGFARVGRAYLARHPSTHPSVRHVGRALPVFLAEEPPPGGPDYLPDLAELERLRVDAFDAPDAEPLTLADLRALPTDRWTELPLTPVPALAVLESAWPVHDAWAADAQSGFAMAPRRTVLRVWREGFVVYHAAMDATEETALTRLRAGASFADVCEALVTTVAPEEAPELAGALLLRWVEDGILQKKPATRARTRNDLDGRRG